MKTITIYDDDYERIQDICKDDDTTEAEVVADLIAIFDEWREGV